MCENYRELINGKCEFCFFDSIGEKCYCTNEKQKRLNCNRSDQVLICKAMWNKTRIVDIPTIPLNDFMTMTDAEISKKWDVKNIIVFNMRRKFENK